ncbi:anillin isoform X4 [Scomber scombrus]|uniref:Anillin isoform X4 n=1 Tax=Scomber scombrus TaxID=13677 RepID=A0AAV1PUK5_SCOSC
MEAGDGNGSNVNMKRQRAPLSDSEDNVLSSSEVNDGQKRRRLEAAGQENRNPKPSSSRGRLADLDMKPDTPIVPSVRSRVQQLTQRREGGAPLAQRCLSDPGARSPTFTTHQNVFRETLLGEGELNQRMERFKVPVFQTSPSPSQSPVCPLTRSNFVSGIHQKLHDTMSSSSKQASLIRQERTQELNQLQFQPISENAWLKRSSSDPTSLQGRTPPGLSSTPSWVPRSRCRVQWPPMKPGDQEDGDADMKDGSFTEAATSGVGKQSLNTTIGERKPCDFEALPASVELDPSNEGQLQMEQNTHQHEEFREEKEDKPSVGNKEQQLWSHQPPAQTVMQLSFSEDQSFSKASCGEDRSVSESPAVADESNVEQTGAVSEVMERSDSEVFTLEEDEEITCDSTHNEVEIEPSTDEELRLWKYPPDKVCKQGESIIAEDQEESVCAEEEREKSESSRAEKEKENYAEDHSEPSQVQDAEHQMDDVFAENAECSNTQEDMKPRSKDTMKQDKKNTEGCLHEDDGYQQSKQIQIVDSKEEDMDLESDRTEDYPFIDVAQAMKETQTEYIKLEENGEDVAQLNAETEPSEIFRNEAHSVAAVQASDHLVEMEQKGIDGGQGGADGPIEETHKAEKGQCSKKVTFILEPELINDSNLSETSTSTESRGETGMSDGELSSHDETNTADIIDQMFEEVLEYAERIEDQRGCNEDTEDRDSGIGVSSTDKDKLDVESEKEKSEEEAVAKDEGCDESKKIESSGDELLSFPPSGILSPLSKSVEAVVTPLRLAASQESNPPSLLLTPEETSTPPSESAPLYSIDAYRTQRQSKPPTIQSVTPGVQRRALEKTRPQPSVNTKEKIAALNEEAGKLQTVINQTLQALSCCTDEQHGRGSLEEAVAEKLLLVSCEKRSALLAEVVRLREERTSESAGEDQEYVSQQPCRGTVSITNIQLPLKAEFVCSSNNRTGRPSHYFFVLIRYGPHNIVTTSLATAADAQNGDTISFQTAVTLKDIRSTFEIDVEVYSLSHTSPLNCSMERTTTKSRVTPRKLLNTLTRSNNSLTPAALPAINTRRSSNFCLVGSHKITLASLGHSKFPLDKVPFLSPLEGNIYLRLESESHSNVQHQGFLTMFELIGGYGVWRRGYFTLERCTMSYWNHPNDKETKEAERSISLSSSPSQCVRPVKRDSCARPFTFELVSNIPQQQDDSQEATSKCWFSADTKQERLDWMEKLNQVLLDFHTWSRTSATKTESQQSSSGNLRESIL